MMVSLGSRTLQLVSVGEMITHPEHMEWLTYCIVFRAFAIWFAFVSVLLLFMLMDRFFGWLSLLVWLYVIHSPTINIKREQCTKQNVCNTNLNRNKIIKARTIRPLPPKPHHHPQKYKQITPGNYALTECLFFHKWHSSYILRQEHCFMRNFYLFFKIRMLLRK